MYKACWTAPDPADDGCATADLVTAIDLGHQSTGWTCSTWSVGGPSTRSTPSSAPCSAPRSEDVVVVAAAGKRRPLPGTPRTRRPG